MDSILIALAVWNLKYNSLSKYKKLCFLMHHGSNRHNDQVRWRKIRVSNMDIIAKEYTVDIVKQNLAS
jgi:hypothetical protein